MIVDRGSGSSKVPLPRECHCATMAPPQQPFDYSSGFEDVKCELDESSGVLLVTLNRPQNLNAMSGLMVLSLMKAYWMADLDDRVKVVVLTGAGRAFCAGADLSGGGFKTAEKPNINDVRDGGGQSSMVMYKCRKVTIAAINGACVGGGFTMTLPLDIRIVWKDAKMAFPFVRRAIVPESMSSYFLPKLVGWSRTQALFMTGKTFPAKHHLFDGLWYEVVDEQSQVLPAAMELAKELAKEVSLVSVALTKSLVHHGFDDPAEAHFMESKLVYYCGNSLDSAAGVESFLKKTSPSYPGRVTARGSTPQAYGMPDLWPWHKETDIRGKDYPNGLHDVDEYIARMKQAREAAKAKI
ncbi:ClpP/crotonase-like domain-containing protein [Hyaloraphidium curvatum]|nr:ClpP/crotonase-like domain-containing protein [Hyaloraphidium curvatum]